MNRIRRSYQYEESGRRFYYLKESPINRTSQIYETLKSNSTPLAISHENNNC